MRSNSKRMSNTSDKGSEGRDNSMSRNSSKVRSNSKRVSNQAEGPDSLVPQTENANSPSKNQVTSNSKRVNNIFED